jgi:hypothetical protein
MSLCSLALGCGPKLGDAADQNTARSTSTATSTETATGTATADGRTTADSGSTAAPDGSSTALLDAETRTDADNADAGAVDAPEPAIDATTRLDGRADVADAIVDTAPIVDNRPPVDTRPADTAPEAPVDTAPPVDTRPADVVNTGSGLIAYYPCESNASGLLLDQSNSNHSATLMPPVSFVTGVSGNALVLGKSQATDAGTQKGYVALPANLFATVNDMTVALWVRLRSNTKWNRVFDVGSNTSVYMFLTPNQGTSRWRFAISRTSAIGEQTIDAPTLELNKWTHVAIVLDATGGHMFVQGDEVASNTSMTMRPSDLGATPNSWFGRSQFPDDAYFDGDMDEIRIYSRALDATEIKALATP